MEAAKLVIRLNAELPGLGPWREPKGAPAWAPDFILSSIPSALYLRPVYDGPRGSAIWWVCGADRGHSILPMDDPAAHIRAVLRADANRLRREADDAEALAGRAGA